MTLDVVVHDAGVPPKSASALVVANIRNVNDQVIEIKKSKKNLNAFFNETLYNNSSQRSPSKANNCTLY